MPIPSSNTPPIELQIGANNPIPQGLVSITNPIIPPQQISWLMRNFPSEVYNLTPDSHIVRLVNVLVGEGSVAQFLRRNLVNRLQQIASGSHFYALDDFYGAVFGMTRMVDEQLTADPTQPNTADVWRENYNRDASYRSRLLQFARALNCGASPVGVQLTAEAILSCPVEVYESDDTSSATLVPHRAITDEEKYSLMAVIQIIKPLNVVVDIDMAGLNAHLSVPLRAAYASSSYWEIETNFVSGLSLYNGSSSRPQYPLSSYTGEYWSLNPTVLGVLSYLDNAVGQTVYNADYQRIIWNDGTSTDYLPANAMLSAGDLILGRAAQSGVASSNPVNTTAGASGILIDGVAINTFLANPQNNAESGFWSTTPRAPDDTSRDILEIRFPAANFNYLTFQIANFPQHLTVQAFVNGAWVDVYDQVIATCIPSQFINPAQALIDKTHPQHYGDGHWLTIPIRFDPIKTGNLRFVLSRTNNIPPLDFLGSPSSYSLGLQSINLMYVVDSLDTVPYSQGVIGQSQDAFGNTTLYGLYEENPNNPLADGTWRCAAQPSSNSVVNYYVDARDSSGKAQVIDSFYIEPTHEGPHCTLYFSNDSEASQIGEAQDIPVNTEVVNSRSTVNGVEFSTTISSYPTPVSPASTWDIESCSVDNDSTGALVCTVEVIFTAPESNLYGSDVWYGDSSRYGSSEVPVHVSEDAYGIYGEPAIYGETHVYGSPSNLRTARVISKNFPIVASTQYLAYALLEGVTTQSEVFVSFLWSDGTSTDGTAVIDQGMVLITAVGFAPLGADFARVAVSIPGANNDQHRIIDIGYYELDQTPAVSVQSPLFSAELFWAGFVLSFTDSLSSSIGSFFGINLTLRDMKLLATDSMSGVSMSLPIESDSLSSLPVVLAFANSTVTMYLGSSSVTMPLIYNFSEIIFGTTNFTNVGDSGTVVASNYVLNDFVLSTNWGPSTVEDFQTNPTSFIIKGAVRSQYSVSTENAYVRFNPSFITAQDTMGFIGGMPDFMANLNWAPISADFILSKGYLTFDPLVANFWKFELTNLVADPMNNFVSVPVVANLFPGSVPALPSSTYGYQGDVPIGVNSTNGVWAGQVPFSTQLIPTPIPAENTVSPSETLVSPSPLAQQKLNTQIPNFGYVDWQQSLSAQRFVASPHNYTTVEVSPTAQLGFFAGFQNVQAFRINSAAPVDVPAYTETYFSADNIKYSTIPIDTTILSAFTYPSEVISQPYASANGIVGMQFATQQTAPVQLILDDQFQSQTYVGYSWNDDQLWHTVGDAQAIYDPSIMSVSVSRGNSSFGGLESEPFVTSQEGRIYIAISLTALTDFTSPVSVNLINAFDETVVKSFTIEAVANQFIQQWMDYDIGSGASNETPLRVSVTQNGATTDGWSVTSFSVFDDGIVWSFSSDNGQTWYAARGIRNNPYGIFTFPPTGGVSQFQWKATFYQADMYVSSIRLRPVYTKAPVQPSNIPLRGPSVAFTDNTVLTDPAFNFATPIPQYWFSAYKTKTLYPTGFTIPSSFSKNYIEEAVVNNLITTTTSTFLTFHETPVVNMQITGRLLAPAGLFFPINFNVSFGPPPLPAQGENFPISFPANFNTVPVSDAWS